VPAGCSSVERDTVAPCACPDSQRAPPPITRPRPHHGDNDDGGNGDGDGDNDGSGGDGHGHDGGHDGQSVSLSVSQSVSQSVCLSAVGEGGLAALPLFISFVLGCCWRPSLAQRVMHTRRFYHDSPGMRACICVCVCVAVCICGVGRVWPAWTPASWLGL
jgi:hypothetical protein